MKRNMNKYLVLKTQDIINSLSPTECNTLSNLVNKVRGYREISGKHPMECVVVECDWPEYEVVWQMIADRVDGKQQAQPLPELSDEQITNIASCYYEAKLVAIDECNIHDFARAAIAADRELCVRGSNQDCDGARHVKD